MNYTGQRFVDFGQPFEIYLGGDNYDSKISHELFYRGLKNIYLDERKLFMNLVIDKVFKWNDMFDFSGYNAAESRIIHQIFALSKEYLINEHDIRDMIIRLFEEMGNTVNENEFKRMTIEFNKKFYNEVEKLYLENRLTFKKLMSDLIQKNMVHISPEYVNDIRDIKMNDLMTAIYTQAFKMKISSVLIPVYMFLVFKNRNMFEPSDYVKPEFNFSSFDRPREFLKVDLDALSKLKFRSKPDTQVKPSKPMVSVTSCEAKGEPPVTNIFRITSERMRKALLGL